MEMEEATKRMKDTRSLFDDDGEFEAADILINLKNLILQSEYLMHLPPLWGAKKGRSVLRDSSSSPAATCIQSPILLSPKTIIDSAAVKRSGEVNAGAPSADSPLLFPSSESDEKSNHCLRRHKDTRRGELLEKVQGLSKNRDLLREEVERVTAYHKKLLALNTELRSLRQKVYSSRSCQDRRVPEIEKPGRCNFGLDLNRSNQFSVPHQQMLFIHPTSAGDYQARETFQIIHNQVSQPLISSNNRNIAGWVNSDGNSLVGVDPVQAWGYVLAKRAKYAENRMNRKNKRDYAKTNVKFRLN